MSKIKNYIIGGLLVSLVILAWQLQRKEAINTALTSENERLALNVEQLLAKDKQQTALILTKDELAGKYLTQRDSLAKLLKVRPKTITKIVERVITQTERDTVAVESAWLKDLTWHITDTGKCHRIELEAELDELDLNTRRTFFNYENKIIDVEGKWKLKFKFLFIKIYDKKQVDLKVIPQCGNVTTKTIKIVK